MLSQSVAYRLQTDPNSRVMVYCAGDSGLTQFTKSDIAFPHQVELKVNLDEVKVNLRGLKNRPGTTQPADVTNFIRKKAHYPNNIVMTYALTQKVWYLTFPSTPVGLLWIRVTNLRYRSFLLWPTSFSSIPLRILYQNWRQERSYQKNKLYTKVGDPMAPLLSS